jgi:hypothetical protein
MAGKLCYYATRRHPGVEMRREMDKMVRTFFLTCCCLITATLAFVTSARASGDRGAGYGIFHKYSGSCGSTYAAQYRQTKPRYYTVKVRSGRYVWRKRRVRVGTLRHRGRTIPQYRWIKKRVLVRPVRYRIKKHRARRRWVSNPIVIQGRSRWSRHGC